jgi:hypothetical protein
MSPALVLMMKALLRTSSPGPGLYSGKLWLSSHRPGSKARSSVAL